MLNWVEVWTLGRPFHSLYSHIVEVVCDNPGSVGASVVILEDEVRSQIVEIWDPLALETKATVSPASSDRGQHCFARRASLDRTLRFWRLRVVCVEV